MATQKEELANLPGVEGLRLIAMIKYMSPGISSHQSPALARWNFSVTGPLIWNQPWAPSYKPHLGRASHGHVSGMQRSGEARLHHQVACQNSTNLRF